MERLAVAALFGALIPVGDQLSALLLSAIVAALLTALALGELRAPDVEAAARVLWGPRRRRLH